MGFRFTLLGIEVFKNEKCDKEREYKKTTEKMVKRKTSKQKKQQAKFGKAVKKCHSSTKSPRSFGNCMSKELKK